ncbi:MAG: 50S ribosomal protein L24e [Candidatus Rokuibacteriota bacterium]
MCTFCGDDIPPGTGKMYVKKDGTIFYFCSSKCQRNQIHLKRVPRRVRWTKRYVKQLRHVDTK